MKKQGLFLLLLFLISAPAASQSAAYRLGPKDVISITITAGGDTQAQADLVVSSQGEINVPFIGSVKAAGLTISSLEEAIFTPLAQDYFVDPQVIIHMKEYHSLSYTISGAVNSPGKYELDFTPTVLDLIAKAGGVQSDRGDIAYILRDTSQDQKDPVTVNLSRLLDQGDITQNIKLVSGDKVYIPLGKKLDQSKTKIYLEGEIQRPGTIDYQPGLTALSACIMAGGFGKYANPSKARVVRIENGNHKIIKVNLDKINDGEIPDFPLKPGDRIHIPEAWL